MQTPVLTQALQIQKLNERNDVQCCVPSLNIALHDWNMHGQPVTLLHIYNVASDMFESNDEANLSVGSSSYW